MFGCLFRGQKIGLRADNKSVIFSLRRSPRQVGSVRALFGVYALVSLLPVVGLGVAVTGTIRSQVNVAGIAEARKESATLAGAAFAPLLSQSGVHAPLPAAQRNTVEMVTRAAVKSQQIVRLRLRDLTGQVVYSDNNTKTPPDKDVFTALKGTTVASLSTLDRDTGMGGERVAEVYQPLRVIGSERIIGVIELYLPYAPIAEQYQNTAQMTSLTLVVGLLILWVCLLAVSMSVTRRLRREVSRNEYLARHDSLTGLPNRERFLVLAAEAVRAATAISPAAIAVIDLDRFKQVNDTLGHPNGDRLLVALSARLLAELPPQGVLSRLDGDGFGIVLSDLEGPGGADGLLLAIRASLARPVKIDGLSLSVEASVGYALAPHDGSRPIELLQHADIAMYASKRIHAPVVRYSPNQETFGQAALALLSDLGGAISNNELVLHYQPKVDIGSGRVVALEALVRWNHPQRGLLYPDMFLPAAEQTELIEQLGAWVLREALLALSRMDPTGVLSMAVNVSARSLTRPGFTREVLNVLTETNTNPARVILEMTETALVTDAARAEQVLRELDGHGIRLSIDDFGAGQTSLAYLATLPVAELKIDKAFVLAMESDVRNAAIVRSVVNLGHSLGFTVIAEGVETDSALAMLAGWACDTAQGYWFSRPAPEAVMTALLAEHEGE